MHDVLANAIAADCQRFDALLKDRNDIACELSFARERITALEERIEGMIEPYSDKDKRIRDLEAEVRDLRSAGYSCPTCDNDAMDSVAETEAKP
jgi:chromosome segregation ATPase